MPFAHRQAPYSQRGRDGCTSWRTILFRMQWRRLSGPVDLPSLSEHVIYLLPEVVDGIRHLGALHGHEVQRLAERFPLSSRADGRHLVDDLAGLLGTKPTLHARSPDVIGCTSPGR